MSFFSDIKQNYELLWKAIIRPPRAEYKVEELGEDPLIQAQRNSKSAKQMSSEQIWNWSISKN